MRIIDLSGLIEEGMWSYGPHMKKIKIKKYVGKFRDVNYSVTLNSINGTYLETAAHRLPGRISLDEVPLKKLITEAAVIRLKEKGPMGHIEKKELEKSRIKKDDAVLISTGWEKKWNKKNFVSKSPHFTREAMEFLLKKKISILGADIPCYDDVENSEGLVRKLFEKDVLILAPLINLRKIRKTRVKLIALPPRIKKTCGFPCRAVAIE